MKMHFNRYIQGKESVFSIMKQTALSGGIVFGPCLNVLSSLSTCFKKVIVISLAFVSNKIIHFFTTQCYFFCYFQRYICTVYVT